MKIRPANDLAAVIFLGVVTALLIALKPDIPYVRAIIGVPFVLFVPGYALTAALFPKQDRDMLERVVYSIGLSIALAIISGVALNTTVWGLQENVWALLLVSLTIGSSLIAWLRRSGQLVAQSLLQTRLRWDQLLLFGLAIEVIITAALLTQLPVPAHGGEGYTMLWIQPDENPNSHLVQVGFKSMELTGTNYVLDIQVNGAVVQEWHNIELKPGQTWQDNAQLPVQEGGHIVEAVLYRADSPSQVYRRVSLQNDQE